MEKYNVTNYHYIGDKHKAIEQILNMVSQSDDPLLSNFITKFYYHTPMSYLSKSEIENFYYIARNSLDFLSKRNHKEVKINIFTPNILIDDSKFSIIQIITDNSPFLVDSTILELKRHSIEPVHIIHPVLFVSRNNDGKLLDIMDSDIEVANPINESLICILVPEISDNNILNLIQERILFIFKQIGYACSDWKLMLGELSDYAKYFNDHTLNEDHLEERVAFLEKLEEKYFVFLGCVTYQFSDKKKNPVMLHDSILGILKLIMPEISNILESTVFNNRFYKTKKFIEIGKLNKVSSIHRNANLDYVCIKKFNQDGEPIEACLFIGLFTSILYYQSVTLIPLIRKKVHFVLEKAELSSHSHSGKEIVSIMESLPRDELFQISIEELYKITMEIFSIINYPKLRIFLRNNDNGRYYNIMVFIPVERANSEAENRMKEYFSSTLGDILTWNYMQINDSKLSYYHIILDSNIEIAFNLDKIEKSLDEMTSLWSDKLKNLLISTQSHQRALSLYNKYKTAFPISYRENSGPNKFTIEDIEYIELLMTEKHVYFNLSKRDIKDSELHLRIYTLEKFSLTDIIPIIQNIGFTVIDEHIYPIKLDKYLDSGVWIIDFYLSNKITKTSDIIKNKNNIENSLYAIWKGLAQNDTYNTLILSANLNHRQVSLLRAIGKYLLQIAVPFSKEFMGNVLNKHPEITKLIIELFYDYFEPKERVSLDKYSPIAKKIADRLLKVYDTSEDKLIRHYVEVINSILRTNYFIELNGIYKDYISFKIQSDKIERLPLPKPFREIFVYATKFEAIHLRGGKVARGGIRWSDRTEDFRTEVLGLMKAQQTKNAVIVPVGSKGGFVIKNAEILTNDEFKIAGIECYKNFIRGLLDITDNIISGQVVKPKNVVCYDSDDPYLVVAADKGTATFSDIANVISSEYNFWLSDAFASGGSAGYDHKKMGITAKGAWISVTRHFKEMGVDIQKQDFTVLGIGDMSGDVFGNGMLLSKHIKLIASFNHVHIFIDPNPDSLISYKERQRLFNKPGSKWTDYNPMLLSKGGMIYSRKDKILELTKEIQDYFNIKVKKIDPNELIKILLRSNVDLIWNGGIGTYIRSKNETNLQVGDKTNDPLRVDGEEVKAKVIGEGGNLGCTQLGRIEYAKLGGCINTDFIDNSAGVDCSDHEVNIKIALQKALENHKITLEERNKILEDMKDEVSHLILKDNILQTQALSIAFAQGHNLLISQEQLIDKLEQEGKLDRKIEYLPSSTEFAQRHAEKKGLTRPELAILLAYSKNVIYENLLNSDLPNDPYFEKELFRYFPKIMNQNFSDEIRSHPLRREIITTSITNSMVNRIAVFFVHSTSEDSGIKFCDIAKAYIITRDVFNLRELWNEIEELDGKIDFKYQAELFIEATKFVQRCTSWLLRNYSYMLNISEITERLQYGIELLKPLIENLLRGTTKEFFNKRYDYYTSIKVPKSLAKKIALLRPLSSAYNIVDVSNNLNIEIGKTAEIYFEVGKVLDFGWLRTTVSKVSIDSKWQRLEVRAFKDDLYDQHRKITADILKISSDNPVQSWLEENNKQVERYKHFISVLRTQEHIEFAMLDLALKRVSNLLIKKI